MPLEGRGSLPFALLRGESLVACATWALGEAGVDPVDFNVAWWQVRDSGRDLVVHDPLCPLTPPGFLASALATCRRTGRVVVAEEPGTGRVASPVVLPATLVAVLPQAPDLADLEALVVTLSAMPRIEVERIAAPETARRVTSAPELAHLEQLEAPVDPAPEDPTAPLR